MKLYKEWVSKIFSKIEIELLCIFDDLKQYIRCLVYFIEIQWTMIIIRLVELKIILEKVKKFWRGISTMILLFWMYYNIYYKKCIKIMTQLFIIMIRFIYEIV